jgi:hypothetical protein
VQFGSLNFALAFVALFGTVTTLGLEGIVVREVLHNAQETHQILGTTLALRSGGGEMHFTKMHPPCLHFLAVLTGAACRGIVSARAIYGYIFPAPILSCEGDLPVGAA